VSGQLFYAEPLFVMVHKFQRALGSSRAATPRLRLETLLCALVPRRLAAFCLRAEEKGQIQSKLVS